MRGMVLSGPVPILEQANLVSCFASWTLTVVSPQERLQLPSAENALTCRSDSTPATLPLMSSDPLAAEQFCLVLTAEFSLVMALGETIAGDPVFRFSFEPEVITQAWRTLQARLKLTTSPVLPTLESLVEQFAPVVPDYRTVMQFSRLMLTNLPDPVDLESDRPLHRIQQTFEGTAAALPRQTAVDVAKSVKAKMAADRSTSGKRSQKTIRLEPVLSCPIEPLREEREAEAGADTELLQAIAHEVRTPLTTIRTLTRLLLKRKDLNPDVLKRLETIDRECTEQIDRFSLIFRAVELETNQTRSPLSPLSPISLTQLLQQNVTRWQQQASQHSHTLEVSLPQKLPMVVTDPTMLDQALTGLVDRITHSLPPGSRIHMRVTLAGHQLKLQFESHPQGETGDDKAKFGFMPTLKSIGQLLMFQPETGNLSLNMSVTKNLFQALGGKLIVKQNPQQGEILTIFLPLETR
jgi:signal transduction histidine kinase